MRVRLRDFWCFLGTGIGSIVFFNYCYFTAVRMMSLAAAAVLLYTAPAFVMLMSAVLFREKMTGRRVLSVLLTFAGCAFVTGFAGSGISASGILVGLGAGFGYALYTIFGHYAIERGYDSLTITFYTFLVAAVTSLFMVRLPHVAGAFPAGRTGVRHRVDRAGDGSACRHFLLSRGADRADGRRHRACPRGDCGGGGERREAQRAGGGVMDRFIAGTEKLGRKAEREIDTEKWWRM